MIVVTRLNDSQFAINPDLLERIANYRARVIALSHVLSAAGYSPSARPLGLVDDGEDESGETGDTVGDPVPLRPRKL